MRRRKSDEKTWNFGERKDAREEAQEHFILQADKNNDLFKAQRIYRMNRELDWETKEEEVEAEKKRRIYKKQVTRVKDKSQGNRMEI